MLTALDSNEPFGILEPKFHDQGQVKTMSLHRPANLKAHNVFIILSSHSFSHSNMLHIHSSGLTPVHWIRIAVSDLHGEEWRCAPHAATPYCKARPWGTFSTRVQKFPNALHPMHSEV